MEKYIPIFLSGISVLIAVFAFFGNRKKDNAGEGERWGRLEEKIDRLIRDVEKFETKFEAKFERQENYVKNLKNEFNKKLEDSRKEYKEELLRVHSRVDEILKKGANKNE